MLSLKCTFESFHQYKRRPRWDVTGFGLDDFQRKGIVLVNLTELPEYCEKVMFGKRNQVFGCKIVLCESAIMFY